MAVDPLARKSRGAIATLKLDISPGLFGDASVRRIKPAAAAALSFKINYLGERPAHLQLPLWPRLGLASGAGQTSASNNHLRLPPRSLCLPLVSLSPLRPGLRFSVDTQPVRINRGTETTTSLETKRRSQTCERRRQTARRMAGCLV